MVIAGMTRQDSKSSGCRASHRIKPWPGSVGAAAAFREPGGVCAGGRGLYIADTNSHRVALADWATGDVHTVVAG
jgi:hypothetical protein